MAARLAELWFLLRARIALMTGRREAARRALKAVVRRQPHSFAARFALGRLYWRSRATVKARREFDLAWQIDPERFERAYARLRGGREGAPEIFTGPDEPETGAPVLSARASGRLRGDFVSEREALRFADMPPISPEEIEAIDWDRLESDFDRDARA